MVLGIRSKSKRESSVHVSFLIHLQEIKPWSPSQSLKAQTPVILHWERGDRHTGSTRRVIPQVGPGVSNGKIVFNESFLLPATLFRESTDKGRNLTDGEKYQKKCLDLNLYESKTERTVKGQLLGSAVVDLAQYGNLKSSTTINVTLKLKRSYRNAVQPSLFLSIGPYEKNSSTDVLDTERVQACVSSSTSPRYSLSSRTSLGKDSRDDTLMSDEGAEEAEIASFTDDDEPSSFHSLSPDSTCASEAKLNSPSTKLEHSLQVQQVEEEVFIFA